MNYVTKISDSGNKYAPVLQYITRKTVYLNMPFILTEGKLLTIGQAYMKTENWLADSKTEAVKLLDIYDYEGIVNLKVQSLNTLQITTLSWNMEYDNGFWLWTIASPSYLSSSSS